MDKRECRKLYSERRKQISTDERKIAEEMVWDKLVKLPELIQAESVFAYLSDAYEFPTRGIVEKLRQLGKKVYLPVVQGKLMWLAPYEGAERLKKGAYDLDEPMSTEWLMENIENEFDEGGRNKVPPITLVPAVAYDHNGGRLGRGGGYYDRFLSQYIGFSVGLCFEVQLSDEPLPMQDNDCRVNRILTEKSMVCV